MKNCELEFKLEDVLEKFDAVFQKKILHSVDLLRKSEKLAEAYDPTDHFFLAFSGGKDSQCLYHVAKLAGVKFKAHMNLTSVDPAEVIRFVRTEYPDVEFQKPKDSIFNIAVKKGILPTMRVRWCCAEYKEMAGAGKVTLIGIRHSESTRRAKRNEVEVNNHAYSGDLEGLAEYRKKRNSGRKPRKGTFSIINVNGESEVGCIRGKESLLISPIIDWNEKDVWTFLNTLGIKHCSLYDDGYTRIGCILCPMSSPTQKKREEQRWPHVKRNWIKAIKRIRGGGVFKAGYIWWNIPSNLKPLKAENGRLRLEPERRAVKQICRPRGLAQIKSHVLPAKANGNGRQRCSYPPQDGIPECRLKNGECWIGFSDGASSDGLTEAQENDIAENIYDWWTSGLSYQKWYTRKFLSPSLFEEEKDK